MIYSVEGIVLTYIGKLNNKVEESNTKYKKARIYNT